MSSSFSSLPLPNPHTRGRANSTSLRPNLTIKSCGRRRSSSLGGHSPQPSFRVQQSVSHPTETNIALVASSESSLRPNMFAMIASRCLQLLHGSPKHSLERSTPSSPRSSTDDYVLPTSASSQQTTFGDIFGEKEDTTLHAHSAWWQGHLPIHAPILIVITLFPLSAALVLFCLSTLPVSISWPQTITDVATLGRELHGYSQSGIGPMAHVVGVLSVTAVWKHTWSIPGSVIWNVLAGALFSPALATLLLTALTALGSIFATLLAMPLAPFITHFFPRALDMTRSALEGDVSVDTRANTKSPAWVRLSVLRLVGVVPWSGINIASGVCGVALSDCILGSFIGSLPWTAVTCQIGNILQTVATTPSPTSQSVSSLLISPEILTKLAFLSFLSLAPILGRDRLRSLISPGSLPREDERQSRWIWAHDWRTKIRFSSRSRTRETSRKQLEILIQEKQEMSP